MGCNASSATTVHECQINKVKTFHESYCLGKKLGRGAFAQVRDVTKVESANDSELEELNKKSKAVKIIDLRDKDDAQSLNPHMQKATQQEILAWNTVGEDPSCVRLFEVFFESEICYLVMEKCTNGLLPFLEQKAELNERTLGVVFAQMLAGIAHVHSARVIHRDIKPDNFLVGGADGQTIKLADFGLSTVMPKHGKVSGVYGTAPFMCPEMIKGGHYNEGADTWSLAVIAYALLFGNFPYLPKEQTSKGMKKAIAEGATPSFQAGANDTYRRSDCAVEFVRALLEREADKRPTASDALNMPYMVNALDGSHMSESELPSLRPALYAARKCGAFEVRDPSKETRMDKILNKMQMAALGAPLPEVRPSELSSPDNSPARKSRNPKKRDTCESEVSMKSTAHSTMWHNSDMSTGSSMTTSTRASSGAKSPEWNRSMDRTTIATTIVRAY